MQWDPDKDEWLPAAWLGFPVIKTAAETQRLARQLKPALLSHLTSLETDCLGRDRVPQVEWRELACLHRLVKWLELTGQGKLLHGASLARCLMRGGPGGIAKREEGMWWHEEGLSNVDEGPCELMAIIVEYLEHWGTYLDEDQGAPVAPGAVPLGWGPQGHRATNEALLVQFGLATKLGVIDAAPMWDALPSLITDRLWTITPCCPRGTSSIFLDHSRTATLLDVQGRVIWQLHRGAPGPRGDDERPRGWYMTTTTLQTQEGLQLEAGKWKPLHIHGAGFGSNEVVSALVVPAAGAHYVLALKLVTPDVTGRPATTFTLVSVLGLPDGVPSSPE